MSLLIDALVSESYLDFKQALEEKLQNLVSEKLNQVKMRLVAEMYEDGEAVFDYEVVDIEESTRKNIQKMGRTKIVRVRFRGGKIQRRVKKSAVKGYEMRGGKLTRMSSLEKRHRKMAARKAKFKRRAKMQQSIRKRSRTLRRRRAMGI